MELSIFNEKPSEKDNVKSNHRGMWSTARKQIYDAQTYLSQIENESFLTLPKIFPVNFFKTYVVELITGEFTMICFGYPAQRESEY